MAKLLVCGLKQTNPSQTKEIFSAIADLALKGLVGFDFAGNEAEYPTEDFRRAHPIYTILGLALSHFMLVNVAV